MSNLHGEVIPCEKFVNKLRELGYTYKREKEHVKFWKKGPHIVDVRKNTHLSVGYVRSTLKQCGCDQKDIDTFIGQTKVTI